MAKKKSKSKPSRVSSEKSDPSGLTTRRQDDVLTPSSAKSFALLKLCRLCESKDGPFLNIFEDDNLTSKKMDELLPFSVSEKDGLPHKICFRCSAKVEELYEFVQKCKKSQENMLKAFGTNTVVIKHKTRLIWEEKLIKSNMSNEDICEKIVKKAMEGMTDTQPFKTLTEEEKLKQLPSRRHGLKRELRHLYGNDLDDSDNVPLKQIKHLDQQADKPAQKLSQSVISTEPLKEKPLKNTKSTAIKVNEIENTEISKKEFIPTKSLLTFDYDDTDFSYNSKKEMDTKVNATSVKEDKEEKKDEKPFDIMDHVSTIKVNGVGILFQCKLCNRNFLKKEVVIVHGCAKTGIPKVDLTRHTTPPPEPPKIPTVKYINTKTDGDLKRGIPSDIKGLTPKPDEVKPPTVNAIRPKPRIGPASRVKKDDSSSNAAVEMAAQSRVEAPLPTLTIPSVNANTHSGTSSPINIANAAFSLNSRYKLVPGPNNTISLVEENTTPTVTPDKPNKSRKKSKQQLTQQNNDSVIELDDNEPVQDQSSSKPYPISFYKSSQMSSMPNPPALTPAPRAVSQVGSKPFTGPLPTPPFTGVVMKKQSYTIVQTGNPSKLLISTKPPPVKNETPSPEVPKKKTRKSRHELVEEQEQQPFKVTLEEATPPKDAGFFTYVNIDPLLQPTYGIPGDKIIQESQISTSTSVEKGRNLDGKYNCNMCSEVFSREKKLLTHIQAHYTKMDEEDNLRSGSKTTKSKKKSKRSTL